MMSSEISTYLTGRYVSFRIFTLSFGEYLMFKSQYTEVGEPKAELAEELAGLDEAVLEEYINTGTVSDESTAGLIAARRAFPCWFGSALKLDGVKELLNGLEMYTEMPEYPKAFGAKVFKIAHDNQGARLTYLKVTGGALPVKMVLKGGAGENVWAESRPAPHLFRWEIPPCGGSHRGRRVRRNGPHAHVSRAGTRCGGRHPRARA